MFKQLLNLLLLSAASANSDVMYNWQYIKYKIHLKEERRQNLLSNYNATNVILSGITVYNNSIILALPRHFQGVPATLGVIPFSKEKINNQKVEPFPDWESNEIGNCDAFQNVQNIEVDKFKTLWVLDNGVVESLTENPITKCPPSITLLDFNKKPFTIDRIVLPSDKYISGKTDLSDIVIDNRFGDFAYIVDNNIDDPGIIVFNRETKKFLKVRDPETMKSNLSINTNQVNFNFRSNIVGIALGPVVKYNQGVYDRNVYYYTSGSNNIYSLKASQLVEAFCGEELFSLRRFVKIVYTTKLDIHGMKMDDKGILYFGIPNKYVIGRWDPSGQKNFEDVFDEKIPADCQNFLPWTDSITFDNDGYLLVLMNRLPEAIRGQTILTRNNYMIAWYQTFSNSYVNGVIPDDDIKSTRVKIC